MSGEIIEYVKHEELPSEEIRRRVLEKAQILADLEARKRTEPVERGAEVSVVPAPVVETVRQALVQPKKITADAEELTNLVLAARGTEEEAEAAEEMARSTRLEADRARQRLNDYMREHGLA